MPQLKTLFNIFRKRPSNNTNEKIKLVFYLDQDNQIKTQIDWSDDSESTSDLLASMLYCLNKGLFYTKIIDMLNESAAADSKKSNLIRSVLKTWNYLCEMELLESNEPIVKPLGAFNANSK